MEIVNKELLLLGRYEYSIELNLMFQRTVLS